VVLRNLHRSSVSRSGGRRECKQLSLESIFLKKDLLFFLCGLLKIPSWTGRAYSNKEFLYFVAINNPQYSFLIRFQLIALCRSKVVLPDSVGQYSQIGLITVI